VIAGDQFVATCEAKSAGCINMPESISSDGGEEEEDADPEEGGDFKEDAIREDALSKEFAVNAIDEKTSLEVKEKNKAKTVSNPKLESGIPVGNISD
jgi:hypothetical protein